MQIGNWPWELILRRSSRPLRKTSGEAETGGLPGRNVERDLAEIQVANSSEKTGGRRTEQSLLSELAFGPVFLDYSDAMTSAISATPSDSSNRHFQSGTGLPRAGLLVNQCFTHLTFIRPSRDGCSFASPTCERLFRLPSSKVHANRTRCHSPCILQCRPSRRPFRSSFPFVSLLWSSASGAGPKINFTLKEKLSWQTTNHNPSRLSELAVFRPLSGKTTQTKAPSTT